MDVKAAQALGYLLQQNPEILSDRQQGCFIRAMVECDLPDDKRAFIDHEQSWKPAAEELEQQGVTVLPVLSKENYDFALLLLTRHRDENLYNFTRAMTLLKDGGRLICAAANDLGAGRYEKELARLAGGLQGKASKFKCRAFWAEKNEHLNQEILAEWRKLGRSISVAKSQGLVSKVGIFSANEIDKGTAFLWENLPTNLKGHGADLGAGYGALTAQLLRTNEAVTGMDLYEAEALALECAEENLQSYQDKIELNFHWRNVLDPLKRPRLGYDFVIMNPPFHVQKYQKVSLGQQFVQQAAKNMRGGGQLWMVANRGVPYEETLQSCFRKVEKIADDGHYHIWKAIK